MLAVRGSIQFTRWLSSTLSPTIRVNAISPGGIARSQPSVFVERYCARTPLRRGFRGRFHVLLPYHF